MMLTVDAPDPLDGATLRRELADAGVAVGEDRMVLAGLDLRFLDLDEDVRETVEQAVAEHTGEPSEPPQSSADRIAALEARLDDVAALAERANVTAQEIAAAARPAR